MSLRDIEIIVGTYEEFVLGYTLETVDDKYRLVQSFANHSHTASIRCVTLNGTVLATGGADETIHLYDLGARRESGMLMQHNGTVNCLTFSPDGCYLMSGGNDGVLAVYRAGNWVLEKEWGAAHKGSGILELSIHPSGKLALSVGANGTLCTWNLVKGRRAFTTRLTSSKLGGGLKVSSILWSPCGQLYAVAIASKVDVYEVNSAGIKYSIAAEKKVNCLSFLNERLLCLACDEGRIELHDIVDQKQLSAIQAHEERVKCVASVSLEGTTYMASASSGGEIKLWKLKGQKLIEMCAVKSGCRITCITIATCGIADHLAIKEEEEDDKTGILDIIPQREDRGRGVVVVQLDGDDDDDDDEEEIEETSPQRSQNGGSSTERKKQLKKQKKKKKKRKILDQQKNGVDSSVSHIKPLKRKASERTSGSIKKKKKNSGAWKVTETKTKVSKL